MATVIKTKNGKQVVLLNPAERGKRYSRELANRKKHDGTPLTDTEAAFRMGVLNERKTQAKIYNKQHALKGKSAKTKAPKEKKTKREKFSAFDDFEFDSRGHIKGSTNCNGFFEAD